MLACALHAREEGRVIEGIAISNQRETAVCWTTSDASGKGSVTAPAALGNAISWQCRRSAGISESVRSTAQRIKEISGLPWDPLLTAGKWSWALSNDAAVRKAAEEHRLRLGTVDAWLLACLTDGLRTARTSRTPLARESWIWTSSAGARCCWTCLAFHGTRCRMFGLQHSTSAGAIPFRSWKGFQLSP